MSPVPIVTLLTDFGAGSGYPAQLRAVLLSRVPGVELVDLSHEVPRHDILTGALLLEACLVHFPPHAVHLAVVDPGVGTARRAITLSDRGGRRLVGPDNGLFTPFLEGGVTRELTNPDLVPTPASRTFHGRDLFAPVAAFLASGGEAERLGPVVPDPVRLDWAVSRRVGPEIHGECLVADHFGNVLTSVQEADLHGERPAVVVVAGRTARPVETYGEGEVGELLALVGSTGRLEIAVCEGSAAELLPALRGAKVVVRLASPR
jgi:S-adenosyl-L-methionine hydrolase (adenosine-forming)